MKKRPECFKPIAARSNAKLIIIQKNISVNRGINENKKQKKPNNFDTPKKTTLYVYCKTKTKNKQEWKL